MTSTSEKRKCPRTLSSTEAPLCRREVGGEIKESAQGTMGSRFFPLPIVTRALTFIKMFLSVSQRKTAKERSLHTILGFPLRNLTACDFRKKDVTKYKSDAAKLRSRILVMADLFSRILLLPLKNYQIDFFQFNQKLVMGRPMILYYYFWYLNPFCNPIVPWCGVSRSRAAVIGCK